MRFLIVIFCLAISEYCYCQIDCKSILNNYQNTIDTSKRPVYLVVENMPDIIAGSNLLSFFAENIQFVDSSKCFPIYIYYGFVVEADCSISNVMICPTLMFCDENEKIELIEQKYVKSLSEKVLKIKTNAGLLKGEKVAVLTKGRIHFDPSRQ